MLCTRCIMIVQLELEKLGIRYNAVSIGKADIVEPISPEEIEKIKIGLVQSGLELIDDKKSILIEKIKNVVAEMIEDSENQLKTNFSDHLSSKLNYDYTYLANIFSEEEGVTIEHFIIASKIERVKELMYSNEFNLTEISWKLNYSSVAHLSMQFKKITGITPSRFKTLERQS